MSRAEGIVFQKNEIDSLQPRMRVDTRPRLWRTQPLPTLVHATNDRAANRLRPTGWQQWASPAIVQYSLRHAPANKAPQLVQRADFRWSLPLHKRHAATRLYLGYGHCTYQLRYRNCDPPNAEGFLLTTHRNKHNVPMAAVGFVSTGCLATSVLCAACYGRKTLTRTTAMHATNAPIHVQTVRFKDILPHLRQRKDNRRLAT